MNWTEPQAAAVTARSGHLLCSAAAGSGKTAVLAARVVGRIADPQAPVEVDRLLVVTFTRAAAAEMRRRVAAMLRAAAAASPRLERQLWLLPRADITTIHGFCERTVRRHFLEVGTDPAFNVLDEGEARALLEEALDGVLEERYAGRGMSDAATAAMADMVERYGGRHLDEALRGLVLDLRRHAQSEPDPGAWLAGAVRAEVDWTAAREVARRRLTGCQVRTEQALAFAPEAYIPALQADRDMFGRLLAATAAGPWDAMAEMLRSASLVRLAPADAGSAAAAERARDLRQANRGVLADLAAGPFGRAAAQHAAEAAEVAGHLRPLTDLALDVERAYSAAKRHIGALDFDDLEHRCLHVLRGTGGDAVGARYAEVLVDEAQDLSPVQDELLSLLVDRGTSLFAVGDVRQSIYGFRQAEPGRFVERERRYAGGGGRLVALPHNFRSRRPVVRAVNYVFGRLFRATGAELPESALLPMEYAAGYPSLPPGPTAEGDEGTAPGGGSDDGRPVRLALLEGDLDEDSTSLEREAAAVCRQVGAWLASALVHDPDAGAPETPYRAARPGDVAVLLRAPGGTAHAYVDALRAGGIPCWSPDQGRRADTLEGRTVLAWWRTLENPQQDIPLAATLLGPFGGFAAAEVAEVRRAAPASSLWHSLHAFAESGGGLAHRAAAFLERLQGWRTAARRGSWGELLARTLDETGYAAHVGGLPGGAERRRNLEGCLQRCREADRFGHWGLSRLIAHLEGGGDTVAEAASGAGDAVRVLSIHASKGLEFPLVVVAGLGRRFHGREGSADVLAQRDLGIGARYADLERRVRWPTLGHAVVAARRREEARAEELRVLYVAMTRAREALCLVGTVRNLAERVGGAVALAEAAAGSDLAQGRGGLDLAEGACYADWLLPVLAGHADVAPVLGAHAGIPFRGAADPEGSRWEVFLELGPVEDALRPAAEEADPTGVPAEPPVGAGAPSSIGNALEAPHGRQEIAAAGLPAPASAGEAGDTPSPEGDEGLASRLEAEHAWRYRWEAATRLRAKVGVGDLRAPLWAAASGEEPAGTWEPAAGRGDPVPRRAPAALAGPRWLEAGPPPPQEVGIAAHTLLRHLDLGGRCDRTALAACRADLVARALLQQAVSERVDLEGIARFLAGPLGRRLRARPEAVRREVPFAMRLPAAEVYPGERADGEWVLVQGVIDALALEGEGLLLLDYKTDAAGAAAAPAYRAQVEIYARAAASAWRRPVTEAWLCFLATGEDVPVRVG